MGRELQLCLDFAASWYGDRLDYAFSQVTWRTPLTVKRQNLTE